MGCVTGGSGGACGTGGCRSTGTGLAWQRLWLDEILARLYPGATWGELDYEAAAELGPSAAERAALAPRLALALGRPCYLQRGAEDELCDYLWLRRDARAASFLHELREGLPAPEGAPWASGEAAPGEPLLESYLRVAVSAVARVAHIRDVTLRATPGPDGWTVETLASTNVRAPGAKLLEKRLVLLLDELGLVHLDWRLVDGEAEGVAPGEYPRLYGAPRPTLAALLFSPYPNDVASTVLVEVSGGSIGSSGSVSLRPSTNSEA